jgi:tyrosyl-tRNA synthetase
MLAREVAPRLGFKPPVCLHNPLLPGLQLTKVEGSFDDDLSIDESIKLKMSKSVGRGALWINDSPEDVRAKYKDAFCPEKVVIGNPVLDHARMLVFSHFGKLEIERPRKYGGDITFHSFEELAASFRKGNLHPLDLKNGVSESVVKLLEPVAKYFEKNPKNLKKMRQLTVTR